VDARAAISRALAGHGSSAGRHIERVPIHAIEHETKLLPPDMILPNGDLDIYDDVLKFFRPVFVNKQAAVQCGGWLGYIPLNDHYALDVGSRVPVGNLERLIGLASGCPPRILEKYTRHFTLTTEQPASLFDFLADRLIETFEHIWKKGLLKTYELRQRVSQSPAGKIDPFVSVLHTKKVGRPAAVSTAFFRTPNCGSNRVLRLALERLLQRYICQPVSDQQRHRIQRIRRALERLEGVTHALTSEIEPLAIARYGRHLPTLHDSYGDALLIAQLVIADLGLAIRRSDGTAVLPTILIDMATTFEDYARRLLAEHVESTGLVEIKNGNHGGDSGARTTLFEDARQGINNPAATPDIVVTANDSIRLIIDVKYKPAPMIPDRADVNQVICYGARYNCEKVMLLYASRMPEQPPVECVGKVGSYLLYSGQLNLGAEQIEDEEKAFAKAVVALI
jgi:5-methylcytosine-specific restriction enzyme subunit McrC